MQWPFPIGQVWEIQTFTKLCRIEQRNAGVDDLEVNFHEIEGKSEEEGKLDNSNKTSEINVVRMYKREMK